MKQQWEDEPERAGWFWLGKWLLIEEPDPPEDDHETRAHFGYRPVAEEER